jgi:uncharacterized protein (TIGR02145 family)
MSENLKAGKYTAKHCYNNNVENCKTYGGLFDWQTMMHSLFPDNDSIGHTQGICPDGWHIPVRAEWQALIDYLGGNQAAGGKMKEPGSLHWSQPNNASGESGFNALPGGAYFYNKFSGLENTAYFWSASRNMSGDQYSKISYKIVNSLPSIMSDEKDDLYSFSVRCIKNPSGGK